MELFIRYVVLCFKVKGFEKNWCISEGVNFIFIYFIIVLLFLVDKVELYIRNNYYFDIDI